MVYARLRNNVIPPRAVINVEQHRNGGVTTTGLHRGLMKGIRQRDPLRSGGVEVTTWIRISSRAYRAKAVLAYVLWRQAADIALDDRPTFPSTLMFANNYRIRRSRSGSFAIGDCKAGQSAGWACADMAPPFAPVGADSCARIIAGVQPGKASKHAEICDWLGACWLRSGLQPTSWHVTPGQWLSCPALARTTSMNVLMDRRPASTLAGGIRVLSMLPECNELRR